MQRGLRDIKEHYKMYKAGKHWVYAAITVFSLGVGGFSLLDQTTVSADTVDNSAVIAGQQKDTNESQKLDSTKDQVKSDTTTATEKEEVATDDKQADQSDLTSTKSTDSKATEDDKTAQEKQGESQQEEQQDEDTTDSSNQDKKVVNDAEVASVPINEQDTNSDENQTSSNIDAQKQKATSAKDNETTATQPAQKAESSKKYKLSYSDLLKELEATDNDYSHVTKDNFEDYFYLNGNATYDRKTGIVTLTPDENDKVGNFTLKNKINLGHNFKLTGQINLGLHQNGADGIGLAFHNGNTNDIGVPGGNNGIAGLKNAFGFKLDTWHNDPAAPNPSAPAAADKFGWDKDPNTGRNPFGGFVETHYKHPFDNSKYDAVWWAETAQNEGKDGYQILTKDIIDGRFHDFTIEYDGKSHVMTLTLQGNGQSWQWSKEVNLSNFDNNLAAFMMTASTGWATNKHQFKINEFDYVASQKAVIHYIDQNTGQELSVDHVEGMAGETIDYSTAGKIKEYKKQGYVLESNEFANGGTYDNDALTDQDFYVYFTHGTVPVDPANPVEPNGPIDPENPDGPKYPSDINDRVQQKTITRTIHYKDKETGKEIDKTVTQEVAYKQVGIVDTVTGDFLGYDTTGDGKVDTQDSDKAWIAVDDKDSFDQVTSPDKSSLGYTAPDKAQVDQKAVGHADESEEVTVYYGHRTVPVNPENPGRPGDPINPADPDGPKWPADSGKESLTKPVKNTVNYVDENGNKLAAPHEETVNFEHSYTIDKVTGEISNEKWTPEQTFKDATSPEVHGYHLQDQSQTTVKGQTVDHDDKDLTTDVVYVRDKGTVTISYVDQKGKEVAKGENVNGNTGDKYTSDSKAVDGYVLVETPANANGEIVKGNTQVTYVYAPVGNLVPSSEDPDFPNPGNTKYPNDPTDPSTVGTVTVPEVPGYTPEDSEGNPVTPGTVITPEDPTKDTPIVYVRDKGTVTISYVDQNGKEVAPGENVAGNTGDKYTSASKTVDGYVLVKSPTNANGEIVKGDTKVTYVYAPVGNLVPSSEDPNFPNPGNTQYPNDPTDPTKPGTVEVPDIPGYTPQYPDGTPVEPGTVIIPEDPTKDTPIVYVRDKGSVEVNYVDQNGKHLTDTVKINGNTGDKYDSSSKVIPGYVLTEVPANASGEITKGETTVTYVYTPVGSLVPSSEDPNFPNPGNTVYPNDPTDPNKVGTVIVPNVPGYTPYYNGNPVKPGTVLTPEDPTKDINVVYVKDKEDTTVVSKDPGQPETPNQSNDSQVGGSQVVYNNNKPNKVENIAHQSKNELPQTGEKQNESNGVFATILAFVSVVLGMLGINIDKRSKKNF
ncbi:lectin-like domain-containing protein [Ligilactobacillus acidipiscis]|uniref:lectin-like domain-containing protein n=1 Tax=Ligilactobacillus acidipiscis TaxID=89059 RepID=UPI0022E5044B|nr:MucBP domain-containing protein [Ligilactobacillus acidipiscis]